jgi:outer membrane protein assembly factor BamE
MSYHPKIALRLWPRPDVRSTPLNAFCSRLFVRATTVLIGLCLAACVYRIDIQQGNLLEDDDISQVEVGMTRSQVQFLLGTPMVSDSFHRDRWDYTYYFRRGRSEDVDRRWLVVYFENDRVARIERDVAFQPSS